jgi:hypothetical protein
VERVKYKKYEPVSYNSSYNSAPADPVKEFLIDLVPDIKEEDRKAAAEKVKEKYRSSWTLKEKVKQALLKEILEKRLQEENKNNLAAVYLDYMFSVVDRDGVKHEFDPVFGDIFTALFKPEHITSWDDLAVEPIITEPLMQKLFFFFIVTSFKSSDMPDPHDFETTGPNEDQQFTGEWSDNDTNLFWKFAQMEKDEYIAMYKNILAEAIHAVEGGTDQETEEE